MNHDVDPQFNVGKSTRNMHYCNAILFLFNEIKNFILSSAPQHIGIVTIYLYLLSKSVG
jgi:hypothetical protein